MTEQCDSSSSLYPSHTAYWDVFAASDIMNLEEALEDSPMFRKKIRESEDGVEEFTGHIKKVLKACKHYQAAAKTYEDTFREFIDAVSNFKTNMGVTDEFLDKNFSRFTTGLKEISNFQDFLFQQMEGLVSAPLREFVDTDVKIVKEYSKKYDKATGHLDTAVTKLGQVKKKHSSSKLEEMESDVTEARKNHTRACLDYTVMLNEVMAKKRFEFLERITVYMHAQMTYFHQGYECFKDIEPHLRSYSHYLQNTRKNFEDERKKNIQRKNSFEVNPALALTRTLSLSPSSEIKKGYLFKRSDDVINITNWNKRYFVLKNNALHSYKTGKEEKPDTSIQLLLYTVKSREDLERRNCFELVAPPDKSILLQAETEDLMREWIIAIQGCISNLLNSQKSEDRSTRKALVLDGADTPVASLRRLNPVCADCGSEDPEWASINLGILLCIDCSGTHRSMGVHISKVRSVTLDSWDDDLLEIMTVLGNERVNKIYEELVPTDRVKPTSSASWEVRQKWIRDKYESKKFVKPFTPSKENATPEEIKNEINTSLKEGIKEGNILQILQLIAQGADPSYQDPSEDNQTPVHFAVNAKRLHSLSVLLMNGASPNEKDGKGRSALHCCAIQGVANCAVLLLQKNGSDLTTKDNENHTPLDIAMEKGEADCVTLFRLAQLAREESKNNVSFEESFAEALRQFSQDARSKK